MDFDLDTARVAKRCPADWDAMHGTETVRHCSLCHLNVYNLSGMSRAAAEELVRSNEGERLCVRFIRRPDGTVITDECPVALRALRRRALWIAAATSALVASLLTFFTRWIDSRWTPTPCTPVWVYAENDAVLGRPSPTLVRYVPPGEPKGPSFRSREVE